MTNDNGDDDRRRELARELSGDDRRAELARELSGVIERLEGEAVRCNAQVADAQARAEEAQGTAKVAAEGLRAALADKAVSVGNLGAQRDRLRRELLDLAPACVGDFAEWTRGEERRARERPLPMLPYSIVVTTEQAAANAECRAECERRIADRDALLASLADARQAADALVLAGAPECEIAESLAVWRQELCTKGARA